MSCNDRLVGIVLFSDGNDKEFRMLRSGRSGPSEADARVPPMRAPLSPPLLVGVATRAETVHRVADVRQSAAGVDILEARVDLFDAAEIASWAEACARIEAAGTRVLVTIRLAQEGGRWSRPDAERLPLYEEALAVASWVDVECASPLAGVVTAAAHARGRTAVVSHHDFHKTPPLAELERVVAACRAAGADVPKIATKVVTPEDREALFSLLRARPGMCVIGMGEEQLRVELAARGSLLAYGYLDTPTAPGQPSAAELDARLRASSPAYAARRGPTA
jgi:3-dehydroquinate dehydratase type I